MKYQFVDTKRTVNLSSSIPAAVINQTILSLIAAMETDSIYLNPDLNLNILSKYTGIPAKTISAVINQHLHKSFNEFVNEYRIAAFKEKIQQPEMDNLTFAGIASECGFNSQATFQRTFKQVTGLSPSEFKNQVLQTN
jgi:AraC-like DNA-binding protein